MEKMTQLYEGKAKKVYATEDPAVVIVSYKDDATALDGLKKGTIAGKGVVNNRMTNFLMQLLEKNGVPTHFVEELNDRETAVKKVSIVPLEVIIRNVSAGHFAQRYGVEEGIVFDEPTIGLHPLDVQTLLLVFDRLVESGATVIVIEHDLDVIRNADYIIDMGPGGGEQGGRIVAAGTPEEIAQNTENVTGRHL